MGRRPSSKDYPIRRRGHRSRTEDLVWPDPYPGAGGLSVEGALRLRDQGGLGRAGTGQWNSRQGLANWEIMRLREIINGNDDENPFPLAMGGRLGGFGGGGRMAPQSVHGASNLGASAIPADYGGGGGAAGNPGAPNIGASVIPADYGRVGRSGESGASGSSKRSDGREDKGDHKTYRP